MPVTDNHTQQAQHLIMLGQLTIKMPGQWLTTFDGTSEAEFRKVRERLERYRDAAQRDIERLDLYLDGKTIEDPTAIIFP